MREFPSEPGEKHYPTSMPDVLLGTKVNLEKRRQMMIGIEAHLEKRKLKNGHYPTSRRTLAEKDVERSSR